MRRQFVSASWVFVLHRQLRRQRVVAAQVRPAAVAGVAAGAVELPVTTQARSLETPLVLRAWLSTFAMQ